MGETRRRGGEARRRGERRGGEGRDEEALHLASPPIIINTSAPTPYLMERRCEGRSKGDAKQIRGRCKGDCMHAPTPYRLIVPIA